MKLILIALTAVILIGCRTSSETFDRQTEIDRETLEHLDFQKQTASSVLDSILSRFNATIKKTERHYAPPDSAGNQAVVAETEYDINLEGETTAVSQKTTRQDTNLTDDKKARETGKKIETGVKQTDSRLLRPPQWLVVVALMILIIGIIYKYRKKICS